MGGRAPRQAHGAATTFTTLSGILLAFTTLSGILRACSEQWQPTTNRRYGVVGKPCREGGSVGMLVTLVRWGFFGNWDRN